MHVLLFTVLSKFSVFFRFMRPALTVLLLCQFVGRRVTVWVVPPPLVTARMPL